MSRARDGIRGSFLVLPRGCWKPSEQGRRSLHGCVVAVFLTVQMQDRAPAWRLSQARCTWERDRSAQLERSDHIDWRIDLQKVSCKAMQQAAAHRSGVTSVFHCNRVRTASNMNFLFCGPVSFMWQKFVTSRKQRSSSLAVESHSS